VPSSTCSLNDLARGERDNSLFLNINPRGRFLEKDRVLEGGSIIIMREQVFKKKIYGWIR